MREDEVLGYAGPVGRVSRLAVVAMGVGVAGVMGCFLILPGMVGLVLGTVAEGRIARSGGKLRGVGFARWGWVLGLVGLCSGVLVDGVLLPSISHPRTVSNRSACAANMRGIMQSMVVYAAENNDEFPLVSYSPYSATLNSPTAAASATTADDVLASYYGPAKAQAGSVAATMWILVLKEQVAPKGFICKSDPFQSGPAQQVAGSGRYYDNFQDVTQLSYSFAYPWKGDGTVGKWWANTTDASLPLGSDATPEQGTGTPPRMLTGAAAPANPKAWNSANHLGEGQNIGFADGHAEFVRRPDIGPGNDNIFTSSAAVSTGPARFGGVAANRAAEPVLNAPDTGPFDVVLYPVRNAGTGR